MRYIIVSGGVVSGLGKGTFVSAMARMLHLANPHEIVATHIKIDPYHNADAGMMGPSEHGEVYVLEDGGEVDLDLGNYERATGVTLTSAHNLTLGKIMHAVYERERAGGFLGKTVDDRTVMDYIRAEVQRVAEMPVVRSGVTQQPNLCFVEVGGTVGDLGADYFIRALAELHTTQPRRGMPTAAGRRHGEEPYRLSGSVWVHMSLAIQLRNGEWKSRPTQDSLAKLMERGVTPAVLVMRSTTRLPETFRIKLFRVLSGRSNVWCVPDVDEMHDEMDVLPEVLRPVIHERLTGGCLPWSAPSLPDVPPAPRHEGYHRIVVTGKYATVPDAYHSVLAVTKLCCAHEGASSLPVDVVPLQDVLDQLRPLADGRNTEPVPIGGILLPGGFGDAGLEEQIELARLARVLCIPFLGVCLGAQCGFLAMVRDITPHAGSGMGNATVTATVRGNVDGNSTDWGNATTEEVHPARGKHGATLAIVAMERMACDTKGKSSHVSALQGAARMRVGVRDDIALPGVALPVCDAPDEPYTRRFRHRYVFADEAVRYASEHKACRLLTGSVADEKGRRVLHSFACMGHPYYVCTQSHPECGAHRGRLPWEYLGFVQAVLR